MRTRDVRFLQQLRSSRQCRRCGAPIASRDRFGMSEGVCRPCRGW